MSKSTASTSFFFSNDCRRFSIVAFSFFSFSILFRSSSWAFLASSASFSCFAFNSFSSFSLASYSSFSFFYLSNFSLMSLIYFSALSLASLSALSFASFSTLSLASLSALSIASRAALAYASASFSRFAVYASSFSPFGTIYNIFIGSSWTGNVYLARLPHPGSAVTLGSAVGGDIGLLILRLSVVFSRAF